MNQIKTEDFRTVFKLAREPMAIVDSERELVEVNQAFCELTGQEYVDRSYSFIEVFPRGRLQEFGPGKSITVQILIDGSPVTVGAHVTDTDSSVLIVTFEDPATKEKYFHSQRLETLGMLAGGIAHDFNNVLTGLLGHITYLKTILPQTGPHIESLLAIEEGSKKASTMTQQILNFSRLRTIEQREQVELQELLTKTCGLLRGAFSPAYKLELEMPENSLFVEAVEGKLAQVFVNLVMNSKAAVGDSGRIRIAIELGSITEASEKIPVAVVKVIDDGEGIPDEILDRVFEPYFSTKPHGTGLGLATVRRIVTDCGGSIVVDSRVGDGTVISVILPLYVCDNKQPLVEQAMALERGSERILIVDDEDPVRNVLCVSLKHLGYAVAVARSGNEALGMLEQDPLAYDLVIVDMLMPELSGDQTYFKMREINPDIRALVISGYSSEESVHRILNNGGKGFIQKPFTIEQLSAKVRQCLQD